MKIISQSNNTNNSRVTVEYSSTETGILTRASAIAGKYKCGFSHNVTTKPVVINGEPTFPKSFGTISFNKGEHNSALEEFLKS